MPYPVPQYETATIATSVDVADDMLPALEQMAKGAGLSVNPDMQKYMLGLAVRLGVPHLDPGSVGAQFVDRFDARFGGSVTATDALLFMDDVNLATATAASTGRTLAQVYRTGAHIYLAMLNNDAARFFVPNF